jgi:UDP-glucose 4-epimerase
MKVLVTGGAGFVGSTICSALLDNGHTPIILDSLITGRDVFVQDKLFYNGDIGDTVLLERIFADHTDIEIAIHCAERAAVEQSVADPYHYYNDNVGKTLLLFKIMHGLGCKNFIFCSSASLYDDVPGYMVTENSPIRPRSPFARSKFISEMILKDFCNAYDMRCITMRYFNPIGADPQMRSGLQPKNPINIVGKLLRVLAGDEKAFYIAGKDWGTRDGSCIRDYVHVWDVAMAHVKAAEQFDDAFAKAELRNKNYLPINIGSGIGVTVLEFIYAFENIMGEKVNTIISNEHRPGDIAGSYANISLAKALLGWEASIPIEEAIMDAVRWEELQADTL